MRAPSEVSAIEADARILTHANDSVHGGPVERFLVREKELRSGNATHAVAAIEYKSASGGM